MGDPTAGCRGGGMRGGAAGVRPGPGSPRWGRGAERPPAGAAQPLLRPGSVGTGGGRGSLSSPLSWAQRVVLGGVPCEGAGEGPWAPESVRSARRGVWGTRGGTGQLEQAGPARVPGRGPGRVGEGWSAGPGFRGQGQGSLCGSGGMGSGRTPSALTRSMTSGRGSERTVGRMWSKGPGVPQLSGCSARPGLRERKFAGGRCS